MSSPLSLSTENNFRCGTHPASLFPPKNERTGQPKLHLLHLAPSVPERPYVHAQPITANFSLSLAGVRMVYFALCVHALHHYGDGREQLSVFSGDARPYWQLLVQPLYDLAGSLYLKYGPKSTASQSCILECLDYYSLILQMK